MTRGMFKFTMALVAVLGLLTATHAATIGYWDAAAPGSDPSNTFEGMVNGYNFTNVGADYNAAGQYYDLSGADRMNGVGNENLYDFVTAKGDGTGQPFSIVAYAKLRSPIGTGHVASKTNESGNGQFTGWALVGNDDANGRYDLLVQPGTNANRLYTRTGDHGTNNQLVLLVMASDGSGTPPGTAWYLNGAPKSRTYGEDRLNGTVTNNSQLVLGAANIFGTNNTNMELHFLEILDQKVDDAWVAARWNDGAPLRGLAYIPEPASLALLALGGLLVLRRRAGA